MIVNYNNYKGRLELNLSAFFPTSSTRVRKLYKQFLKIGENKYTYQYVDEIIKNIDERLPDLEETAKYYANEYVDLKTKQSELQVQIKERKKTNGLPFRGDELEHYKDDLYHTKELSKDAEKFYKQSMKELKQLKENRQLLLQLDGRC